MQGGGIVPDGALRRQCVCVNFFIVRIYGNSCAYCRTADLKTHRSGAAGRNVLLHRFLKNPRSSGIFFRSYTLVKRRPDGRLFTKGTDYPVLHDPICPQAGTRSIFSNSGPRHRPASRPACLRSRRPSTLLHRRSRRIRGEHRDSPENREIRRSSAPWPPYCRRPPSR